MNIVIFSPTSTKLSPDYDKIKPIGGADSALLKLIRILGKDHTVRAFIPLHASECFENEILYFPYMDLFKHDVDCDILILNRKIWVIPSNVKYKKLILYSQDTADTPCFNGCDTLDHFDKIIVLSEFHKQNLIDKFKTNPDKFVIIGNATPKHNIRLTTITNTKPLKFIYCSTPFRGLVVLARMWKHIKAKYPEAELHVFSSMKIYQMAAEQEKIMFDVLYNKLKNMKGIKYHGSVPQKELWKHLAESKLLLYPNTYPETYCNVLMESRAVMTPFITSDLGALKETGGDAGVYIQGDGYTNEYQNEFLRQLDIILNDERFYNQLVTNCYPIRTFQGFERDMQTFINSVNILDDKDLKKI